MTENKPEANDTGVEPTRPEQHTATGMIIAAAVILLLMIGFAVAWFAITGKKKGEAKWVDPGRVENKKAAQPVPAVACCLKPWALGWQCSILTTTVFRICF